MVSAEPIPATDATARRPRSRPWITANRLLALLLLAEIAIIWADVNNWADFGVNRLRTFYILAAIVLLPPAVASIRFAIAVIARRRRFQFGVSSVLLVMTIWAAASAWLAWRIKEYQIEEEDVRTIYIAGGEVKFDYSDAKTDPLGPKWLRRRLGDNFFSHAVDAGFADNVSAQLLERDWTSQLESLGLDESAPWQMVTREPFAWQGKITDDALNHVANLTHLKTLFVEGARFTDAGMARIRGLKELRELNFYVGVSDAGMRNLDEMHDLRSVRLDYSGIGDTGLAHLRSDTKIALLELDGCKITDKGIATVERLTNLASLDLSGTSITDSGLRRLKCLTKLQYLNVVDTPVTPFAAEELAAALPHCRIFYGDRGHGGVAGPLQPLPDQ